MSFGHSLANNVTQTFWKGVVNKTLSKRYICVSDTPRWFTWFPGGKCSLKTQELCFNEILLFVVTKKSLRVVHPDEKTLTIGEASMNCSADSARLVTLKSCEQLTTMMDEIYEHYLKPRQKYFLGILPFGSPASFSPRNWDQHSVIDS